MSPRKESVVTYAPQRCRGECKQIRIPSPVGKTVFTSWRKEEAPMVSDKPQIDIRQMIVSDIPRVVELQRRVFPGMPIWEARELAHHLSIFPEGQLVATDETGQIL